jgi:hypothetical protein
MKRFTLSALIIIVLILTGCGSAYKAKPLPFKTPTAYQNAVQVSGTQIGGQAYADPNEAKKAFGFDIRAAGMLPVQLVFDNQGVLPMEISPSQTFLEDNDGNLWPILTDRFAYERATKYAQTNQIFKEGAYSGFLGAAAGTIIGAAVGVVTGEDVVRTASEGAILGAAGGAVLGGAKGATSNEARSAIVSDLRDKSLENKAITPGNLSYGIIFFPGEAKSAKRLRLQLKEKGSGRLHTIYLDFRPAG